MTGKLLPFSHRSRSNSGNHRNNSRLRISNNFSQTNSKFTAVIIILNHRVEVVHHTQEHHILRITIIITLDHNHRSIIGMEIVHDSRSHVIDFVTSETILIHFSIKNKQTTQRLTLKILKHRMSPRKHSSNNNLMI